MKTLTVKELREALEGVDGDVEVNVTYEGCIDTVDGGAKYHATCNLFIIDVEAD